MITIVLTFAFAYLSKRTMPSAPRVPQHFRIHGQTDTDSEADQGDVHMEPAEQRHAPVAKAASAVARFPPMDDASVNADRRRVERRQARRAERFDTGRERLRHFDGNASHRANPRIDAFPPILTFDSRAPPSRPSSSTSVPMTPQRPTAPNPSITRRAAPSPTRGPNERNVRPRSDDIPDAELPENGLGGMDRLARISNQAFYANTILKGKTDLG